MRRLEINIYIFLFAIIISSCTADKNFDDVIETRTSLTSVETINFTPDNSISLSLGYTREAIDRMDYDTYSTIIDSFSKAETSNKELYFDSLEFELIKKIDNINYSNNKQIASLIKKKFSKSKISKINPTVTPASINNIFYNTQEQLLATIEIPNDNSLNWSIVKIWSLDPVKKIPQIHSILIAKANCFDYIKLTKNNLYLGDGDFIYRIVLDEEFRFSKDMDIYVSMKIHKFME